MGHASCPNAAQFPTATFQSKSFKKIDDKTYEITGDFTLWGVTNNPRKVLGLEKRKIQVTRLPLEILATDTSKPYLLTKKTKMSHILTQFDDLHS